VLAGWVIASTPGEGEQELRVAQAQIDRFRGQSVRVISVADKEAAIVSRPLEGDAELVVGPERARLKHDGAQQADWADADHQHVGVGLALHCESPGLVPQISLLRTALLVGDEQCRDEARRWANDPGKNACLEPTAPAPVCASGSMAPRRCLPCAPPTQVRCRADQIEEGQGVGAGRAARATAVGTPSDPISATKPAVSDPRSA